MNCPHCQNELPENYSAMWCPFCGMDLSLSTPPPEISGSSSEMPAFSINWRFFLGALLLPPLLTLVSALGDRSPNQSVSPSIALIGGAIGGIVCGVMIGCRSSRSLPVRIFLSLVMSGVMTVVCILFCFFGCTVGGYQFQID